MAAKTLVNLILEVCDRYGVYLSGTATGGSTSTIEDTAKLFQPDDVWNGHYAYILSAGSAAPEGEERPITDFVQSTNLLTVSPAFSAAVAAADTFEILPFQRSVVIRSINAAIVAGGEVWPTIAIDTSTITIATQTYVYTLPTDLVRLVNVWYRDVATEPYLQMAGSQWRVTGTPGAQELHLSSLDGLNAGDTLRLEYLVRPTELADDDDDLGIGEPAETTFIDYIIEYACGWLHQRAANRGGGDFRERLTSADIYFKQAMEIKKKAPSFHPAPRVRAPVWSRARG